MDVFIKLTQFTGQLDHHGSDTLIAGHTERSVHADRRHIDGKIPIELFTISIIVRHVYFELFLSFFFLLSLFSKVYKTEMFKEPVHFLCPGLNGSIKHERKTSAVFVTSYPTQIFR